MTVIPNVNSALEMTSKGFEKWLEIGGQKGTIQTAALLRSAKIPRRDLEAWGDLLLLNLHWKAIS